MHSLLEKNKNNITQKIIDQAKQIQAASSFPLALTDCDVIGFNGFCGDDCPIIKRGDCEY